VERARPLLETFSRGITAIGKEPYQAYAMKSEELPEHDSQDAGCFT
jgi:hypothetical protein